jgi:hypothetical protein
MPIDVKCPDCGSVLEAPDGAAGKKVKCPDCGARVAVPAEDEAVRPKPEPAPSARGPKPGEDEKERPRRGRDEEEAEDRPRRRRPRDDEDDDDDRPRRRRRGDDDAMSTLIPYKNGKALAAYYCGVFALIPCLGLILGPIALVLGILGLNYVKEHPEAHGTGHAWAGIILGSLVILGHLGLIALAVISAAAH